MKQIRWIIVFLALSMLGSGCRKQVPDEYSQLDQETRQQRKYVNTFAWNVMNTYYLWRDEIAPALEKWQTWEEPIQKVADIRYKNAAGKDIDHWTMLTDDFASLEGGVSGHTRTLGMDFLLYYADQTHSRICAVVTYTFKAAPAAQAGLKRGDAIMTVDGLEMTPDNYQKIVRERLLGGGTVKLGLSDGRSVTVTAADMYEDPVQTVRILERPGGKKVGYLHYTSFTLDSCEDLVDVFDDFVREGINDLVLDLRYNGGGYLITEEVVPEWRRIESRVHRRFQSRPPAPVCPRDGCQRLGLGKPGLLPASVHGRHPHRRTDERQVLRRLSDEGGELV